MTKKKGKKQVWYGTKAEKDLLSAAVDAVSDWSCEPENMDKSVGKLKGAVERFYKSVGITGWLNKIDRR